jgi:hypothetical protein
MIKDLMFATYSLRTAIASLKEAHHKADRDNNLFGELVLRDLLKQAHELEHRLNEIVHTRRWAKEWAKEQVRDRKTDTVDPRPEGHFDPDPMYDPPLATSRYTRQRTTRKSYDPNPYNPPPATGCRCGVCGSCIEAEKLFFNSYAEECVDAARTTIPSPSAPAE